MLNIGKIEEGFVLDHIKAGKSLAIYHLLQLDKLDYTVAIIKNARSNKLGKKDILKIECDITKVNLDVLALIDKNITINVLPMWRRSRLCRRNSIVGCRWREMRRIGF